MSSSQYTYQSAKIRALEPAILDQTDIERMVDAPDFDGAFKILNDTDYADNLLEVDPADFRQALDEDFKQLYILLKNIIPQDKLFKLMFLEKDLVNLKLLFKAKYFGQTIEGMLEEFSYYDPGKLKAYILEKNDLGLDPEIKILINEAEKQLAENPRPDQIASVLTKEYFKLMQALAKDLKNPFLIDLVKIKINNVNIATFLRAKALKLGKEQLADKLIAGGGIEISKLMNQFTEEIKNLKTILDIHYNKNVIEAFENAGQNLIPEMEVALANFETNYAAKSKLIAQGPEVVAAYYLAKAKAAQNIQVILTGKYNKIPADAIKKYIKLVR